MFLVGIVLHSGRKPEENERMIVALLRSKGKEEAGMAQ